ncbi:hypothetical protein [Gracilibacillus dipsosauri]|uniref:hypothetical protein n=1 Tax=Gracilibacillus dipsosauri TaxID=178340 RepID=UPI002409542F
MSKLEVSKFPVVGKLKEGQTVKEHFTDIYKTIGQHFINQAEVLAGDVSELTSSVSITIDLNPNEIVQIDKYTQNIVMGEKDYE